MIVFLLPFAIRYIHAVKIMYRGNFDTLFTDCSQKHIVLRTLLSQRSVLTTLSWQRNAGCTMHYVN